MLKEKKKYKERVKCESEGGGEPVPLEWTDTSLQFKYL